jgi:hypothetical protein
MPPNPTDSSLWKRIRQDRWWLAAAALTGLAAVVAIGYSGWALWAYAGSARARPDVVMNMPDDTVRSAIARLTAAELPAEVWDVHGQMAVFGGTTFHVRFTTTERDLYAYLKASPALPDDLTPGERILTTEVGPPVGWWRPDDLMSVSGRQCGWPAGAEHVTCRLLAGRRGDRMTVYMQFTIERAP